VRRASRRDTLVVSAADGIDYAYRDTGGEGEVPLVLLQHFRGNLDNWDPALIDALAPARRISRPGPPGSRRRAPTGSQMSVVSDETRAVRSKMYLGAVAASPSKEGS